MPRPEAGAPGKIEIVRSFLKRLDAFNRKEDQSIPLVAQLLDRFKAARPELEQAERRWELRTAPNFNIFRVLRLERRETKLHSRFLAELLDPQGSRGQGDRFLTAFLDLGKKRGFCCPSEWPAARSHSRLWEITTEEAVNEYDRLDIVVRCATAKFVMVIENKIDAAEGTKQLERYCEWLQTQEAYFRNLVFLTPDERIPVSISRDNRDKCLCLSYREHVTDWLRPMVDDIQAQKLQLAILQYLQVVESL